MGALLRGWRERALLTQEQLAARAGLNVRTIRRLEADALQCRPRSRSMRLLAEALGLDAAEVSVLTRSASGPPPTPPMPPMPRQPPTDFVSGPAPMPPLVPRQLPTDVAAFAGRKQELSVLDRLGRADPVVTAIDGMAGAGKTALAVHAAHRLAPRFPDGHLFVDLHGFTHGRAPADPRDTLARVLGVLGVPQESIPAHLDDRAALYRSVLAGRKMLIVLDNAADETQVRPLLPGTGGCLTLITSRRRMVGLDGARMVSLHVLPLTDAIALFTGAAGAARVAGTPVEALAELVRRCGLLPLALRLAAARLRTHPAWTVLHLLKRLEERRRRLGELQVGRHSVTAALDLSYRELNTAERRAYRLLGLHPGMDVAPADVARADVADAGADIAVDSAAALLGTTVARASALLDRLLEVNLLREPILGRYRFHDLVRAHAAELAVAQEPEADRRAALARLLDHHGQDTSGTADKARSLAPGARHRAG